METYGTGIPSPRLTANAPENGPKRPKRKFHRLPTIHFQVRELLVSGRDIFTYMNGLFL